MKNKLEAFLDENGIIIEENPHEDEKADEVIEYES